MSYSCNQPALTGLDILRWFGHIERMGSEKFVKKVYMSESVGPNSRGRSPGRWRDRVREYMCERGATRVGGLDQARRECLDEESGSVFTVTTPLGDIPGRSGVRTIDGYRQLLINVGVMSLEM